MAKNKVKRGRSARNGNAASPYKKYNKMPFAYSAEYRHNYLDETGRLCRHGRPVVFAKRVYKEAAE